MLQTFKNGQSSVVLRVKLLDSSATTGAGLTGLTSASSGLIISTIADNESSATAYTVAGSTIETITTLGTYAAPTATKCRFKELDATNHKGIYEIQIADARFAVSSAKSLLVSLSGATNLAQTDFVVQLQSDDPYVAKPANSSLLVIDGSGRVDVSKIAGTAQTARDVGASVLLSAGTGTGQLDFTSGVVKANMAQILGTALTETAGQIAAGFKKFFNIATPASTMDALTLVATATNLTNAPTSGDFTATMKTSLNAATPVATVSGDFSATMKTSLNAATPAVTVSDKTGFSLSSGGLSAVTAWTVAITGNITGNLSGSVGSVTTVSDKTGYSLTQTFPTNFSALGIGTGGHILTVDTLTTYTGNTPQTGDAYARIGAAGAGLTTLGDTRIAHLDADVSSRLASGSYTAPDNASITAIKAKTDNLPASPAAVGSAMTLTVAYDAAKTAAQAGDAMTLTGAYDAAKTAATQTSVDDLPTNAELATALAGADDATLAAIAALPTTTTIMPADIKKVNGTTVTGNGSGVPWGPA